MEKLHYKKEIEDVKRYEESNYRENIYSISSLYEYSKIRDAFEMLRAAVVDINPALVTKCITGTEQDFVRLMDKAKEFIKYNYHGADADKAFLLDMFQECVFGYYVLTPLIKAKDVSDIKVYAWNRITCKANGDRYTTNISFFSEEDYNRWFERLLRIQGLQRSEDAALQYCTDQKGVDDYFLRIDVQLKCIVSTGDPSLHIRKIPKQKYTWDYLKNHGMLDNEIQNYLYDRIASGYNILISGRGGSGKTSLLNTMIDCISFLESVLVVQESDDLYSDIHPQIQFEHTMEMKKKGEPIEYSLEDLLRLGLLQDIDNFVVGEIKGGEALHVFTTALNTGARFFGTIHSNSAPASVRRLVQLARYVSDYPMETLEEMLSSMKFSLIHLRRFSVAEIYEIAGWDSEKMQLKYNLVYKKKGVR